MNIEPENDGFQMFHVNFQRYNELSQGSFISLSSFTIFLPSCSKHRHQMSVSKSSLLAFRNDRHSDESTDGAVSESLAMVNQVVVF